MREKISNDAKTKKYLSHEQVKEMVYSSDNGGGLDT